MENVRLALQRARGASFDFWRSEKVLGIYDDRARELLFDVGLTGEADTVVTQLPYGQKRALEIATTLALDPEVMLLKCGGDLQRALLTIGELRHHGVGL